MLSAGRWRAQQRRRLRGGRALEVLLGRAQSRDGRRLDGVLAHAFRRRLLERAGAALGRRAAAGHRVIVVELQRA